MSGTDGGFKAIAVKDDTKVLTKQYEAKNKFNYEDYKTSAFDFHIFSKKATLNAHTNGNIATKDLFANGQGFGTNQSTGLKLNEENYFMNSVDSITNIASDGNLVIGKNVPVKFEDNNNSLNIGTNGNKLDKDKSSMVYREETSINYIDIDEELENLKTISNLLSNHKTSEGVTLSKPNGENQTITVDGSIGSINNYYLNIGASEISDGNNKRVLNISIPDNKTLIINVNMADVNINSLQYLVTKINSYGNSEGVVENDNNILWNLYNSLEVNGLFSTGAEYARVGTSDYFMGTILAPNANIQYGAVNGSIIANETQQNGQESHKWDFTGHKDPDKKEVSITIEATKTLEGKDLTSGMFSFELLYKDEVIDVAENNSDGKIQFETITYKEAGKYEYKVKEVTGNLPGIIYDERVFDVTVNVTDDGEKKLLAIVNYPEEGIVFTNKYEPKVISTEVYLEATKNLTGKDLVADMFSFNLLDNKENIVETVKNDADGKIKFSTLNFDKVGTYTYKIAEVNEGLAGITYDSQVVDVVITVTDNAEGQLQADVEYPSKTPEFNNSYKAKSTSISIEATKILEGKYLAAGMFSFELLDKDNKVLQTAKNSADGIIKFEAINYKEAKNYEYKVREVTEKLEGIKYDERVFDVIVSVTDNGDGKLVATVNYPNNKIEFTNKYEAKATVVDLETTKTLTGKDLLADMFSFNLLDDKGKIIETVKNTDNGKIKFSTLNFDKIGTYTYKIVEVNEGLGGITYDSQAIDVLITVTDNGEGQLKADVKYPNKTPEFINSYKAKPASLSIKATKKLIGMDLTSSIFSFQLIGKDGSLIIAKNNSDGTIEFSPITYNSVGNYEYTLKEVKGNLAGIIYDERVFDIKVNVTDNGEGKLVATAVYPESNLVFENKLIKGSLEIIKTDAKDGKPLKDVEFTIRDSEGKIVKVGKTDSNGKIVFENLKYGKYTYQETLAKEGYIIDNKEYPFEIKENGVIVKASIINERKSETPSKSETQNKLSKSGSPNTGDTGIAFALIIGLLGVGGLVINNRRKIKDENL